MGGSGGGFFSGDYKPSELRQQVRDAESQARDEQHEAAVSNLIDAQLGQANQRDAEAIGRHLDEIKAALGQETEGPIGLLFGGSIAKRTYVDGLSDVDALVTLNKSDLAQMSPAEVKSYFADRLRERFPQTPVEIGELAVTIKFADAEIQLLPALRVGQGLRIPAEGSSGWSPTIRPDRFAAKLTDVNQTMNGKLVPTIKLVKLILSRLPESQRLTGYHIESLAIQVFEGYNGAKTTSSMLRYFFDRSPSHIKEPIKDSTGQSLHVDDYLGGAGSLNRRIVADSIGRISRSMNNADGAKSLDQWQEILDSES